MQRWLLGVLIVSSAFLGGCAATVQGAGSGAANEPKLAVPEASARKVVLSIVPAKPDLAGSNGWQPLLQEWQQSMKWAADNAKIGYAYQESGARAAAEPAVLVTVKVNDFRFVSAGARWGLGVFSGNAYLDIEASFTDLASGRELGTRKYNTSSSAWQGVFAPMTERQLEAINTEIVREVTRR
jgi:hypothetical protein